MHCSWKLSISVVCTRCVRSFEQSSHFTFFCQSLQLHCSQISRTGTSDWRALNAVQLNVNFSSLLYSFCYNWLEIRLCETSESRHICRQFCYFVCGFMFHSSLFFSRSSLYPIVCRCLTRTVENVLPNVFDCHTRIFLLHQFCSNISFVKYRVSITDHPRSGMVYNFGCVCLSVCLFVCLSVGL